MKSVQRGGKGLRLEKRNGREGKGRGEKENGGEEKEGRKRERMW